MASLRQGVMISTESIIIGIASAEWMTKPDDQFWHVLGHGKSRQRWLSSIVKLAGLGTLMG